MQRFLIRCAAGAITFYLAAVFFPAVRLASPLAALLAGFILAVVHLLIRPLLFLLTLPVNLLTLGLFTFIINTWMVMLTDRFVAGLRIAGFWPALLLSCFSLLLARSQRRRDWN
ncbi:MAG: phage holin family protein [bacterium]|jgi:putative membrane protein